MNKLMRMTHRRIAELYLFGVWLRDQYERCRVGEVEGLATDSSFLFVVAGRLLEFSGVVRGGLRENREGVFLHLNVESAGKFSLGVSSLEHKQVYKVALEQRLWIKIDAAAGEVRWIDARNGQLDCFLFCAAEEPLRDFEDVYANHIVPYLGQRKTLSIKRCYKALMRKRAESDEGKRILKNRLIAVTLHKTLLQPKMPTPASKHEHDSSLSSLDPSLLVLEKNSGLANASPKISFFDPAPQQPSSDRRLVKAQPVSSLSSTNQNPTSNILFGPDKPTSSLFAKAEDPVISFKKQKKPSLNQNPSESIKAAVIDSSKPILNQNSVFSVSKPSTTPLFPFAINPNPPPTIGIPKKQAEPVANPFLIPSEAKPVPSVLIKPKMDVSKSELNESISGSAKNFFVEPIPKPQEPNSPKLDNPNSSKLSNLSNMLDSLSPDQSLLGKSFFSSGFSKSLFASSAPNLPVATVQSTVASSQPFTLVCQSPPRAQICAFREKSLEVFSVGSGGDEAIRSTAKINGISLGPDTLLHPYKCEFVSNESLVVLDTNFHNHIFLADLERAKVVGKWELRDAYNLPSSVRRVVTDFSVHSPTDGPGSSRPLADVLLGCSIHLLDAAAKQVQCQRQYVGSAKNYDFCKIKGKQYNYLIASGQYEFRLYDGYGFNKAKEVIRLGHLEPPLAIESCRRASFFAIGFSQTINFIGTSGTRRSLYMPNFQSISGSASHVTLGTPPTTSTQSSFCRGIRFDPFEKNLIGVLRNHLALWSIDTVNRGLIDNPRVLPCNGELVDVAFTHRPENLILVYENRLSTIQLI